MKILFAHGLEGSPNGRKIKDLRKLGYNVDAPHLPKDDFNYSKNIIKEYCLKEQYFLVGSSRGGAVLMGIGLNIPTVFLAPAYKKFLVDKPYLPDTHLIIHGTQDQIVPIEDSRELKGNLIEIEDNHRLQKSITYIDKFIQSIINNYYDKQLF